MKTPFGQKFISDYFVGCFPQEVIHKWMDESTAECLDVYEATGEDVDWQVKFLNKVLVYQIQLEQKISEAYESA